MKILWKLLVYENYLQFRHTINGFERPQHSQNAKSFDRVEIFTRSTITAQASISNKHILSSSHPQ